MDSIIFDGYKCPICNGNLRIATRTIDFGFHEIFQYKRVVCNHCRIKSKERAVCYGETKEEYYEDFKNAVEKHLKRKKEKELRNINKILTDIRDYLLAIIDDWHKRIDEPNFYEQNIGVYNHVRKELDDLTEYAEKLGVEL